MRAVAQFQRERLESMRVTAGEAGVLQSEDLDYGQWVLPGQVLQRSLLFLLKGDRTDTRYALDFAYHDDATDRITRLNLPVKAK